MEKIAIISDVHANLSALEAVLEDIEKRNIKRIICLGDSVVKGACPTEVLDILKKKCEVILIGNTDYGICTPEAIEKKWWTTEKIGKDGIEFLLNLPKSHQFYMSGQLIRLYHATPYDLDGIYNPMYTNKDSKRVLVNLDDMFKNTEFLGREKETKEPDIIGYGHIHTPFIVKQGNKTIFNTGSVGAAVEMQLLDETDENNKFSTVASYMIIEGNYGSKENENISFTQARVLYDIDKEIKKLEACDMPSIVKNQTIKTLKTAIS